MKQFSLYNFRRLDWKVVMTALIDTALVSIFTLLPLICGVFFLKANNNYHGLDMFYQRGEFLLFALSITVSSYLTYNQFKVRQTDINSHFAKVAIAIIVICSCFYAIISSLKEPDAKIAKYCSLFFLFLSIPLFYYSQYINIRQTSDVAEVRRGEQDEIVNALN